jgi:hypothetical protein
MKFKLIISVFLLIICLIGITSAESWVQVADQLNNQTYIRSLITYDDGTGTAIFGGTSGTAGSNGKLFKYNSSTGGWIQVADELNSQSSIYSLTTYDDGTGTAIYGGTASGGRLFK